MHLHCRYEFKAELLIAELLSWQMELKLTDIMELYLNGIFLLFKLKLFIETSLIVTVRDNSSIR